MSLDVLIIEPSKDLAKVLVRAFKENGLSAQAATSAQEAIALADKNTPKLIVMELVIPTHNGLEFIHEFRSYPDWLDTPIIIYSHIPSAELGLDRNLQEEMGIKEHFYKPTTSLKELLRSVESTVATVNI